MWDFRRLNKARDAYCASHGLDESRRDEYVELGSESPLFRYALNTARAFLPAEVLPQDLRFEDII